MPAELVVRMTSPDAFGLTEWTDEHARTAIGRPLLDRPGGEHRLGEVTTAYLDGDDLVLHVRVDVALDVALYPEQEIRSVATIARAYLRQRRG